MKAHIVTFLIIDFDEVGQEEAARCIENARYPNRCISPGNLSARTVEIGEWDDGHPLNQRGTDAAKWIAENCAE